MLQSLVDWSQPQRDAAYDNSAAVADSAGQLAAYERRSDALVRQAEVRLDIPYGPAERQRYDFFAGQPGAPTLLFIHGGYWQMRHKNTFRFVVEGALAQGLGAALVGYTLAPEASLTRIDAEVRQAIAAVRAHALEHGGAGDILLSGWSAGGHLTAMAMDCPGVIAGLGISGIYDLAPLALTKLNAALQLTSSEIDRLSPVRRAPAATPFVIAYGTAELPQLQAQSRLFGQYRAGLPGATVALEGADHFSILDHLARADGVLLAEIRAAARR
ncbi:alpha/beta hydrolase [Herbaspirillum sp. YR522]|uniref:alpha/beta hydrolase n=1 Tax=Herbaspirillum sp. YR522 TaxID=1144342 RepID=UPI00026FBBF3|nr:alpha/beta hydrolase [Herbaspirillum sp. YR522]EJN08692.1 esterase/lipase [Herbaspirillum sp. YR522]